MSGRRRRPRPSSDTAARTAAALGRLFDAIAPWLFELGNWIFGGLIAVSLIVLGALLTVGPVDTAIKVATAAFALALPLDVAGFVILRLFADMIKESIGNLGIKAFVEAGFSVQEGSTAIAESKLRTVALRYSYSVLSVTLLLTVVGLAAALWHMAWWIGLGFAAMVLVSWGVIIRAISALGPVGRWATAAGEVEPPKPGQAG
ncbi:MAG TPA: hypothetical protein VFR33_02790 [Candidatus Dormibacteraeota bacterium]|nr:hypothetical protein [Candidatus Dormibacteraeota bacterium]